MYPNKTPKSGAFRAVVPSYGQLEQEVTALRDEAAFYKTELEEVLRAATNVAAKEREMCAKTVELARLDMDGSLGLTNQTDFIATRIVDFLAARIRARSMYEQG
jgi:hypothetical protein